MRTNSYTIIFIVISLLLVPLNTNAYAINVLHEFAGGDSDGRYPYGSLTLYESTLYGMTVDDGQGGQGIVFKIGTNGTGYNIIHSFTGEITDGSSPFGSLLLDGSTFYGLTAGGGWYKYGTLFKINTDGSGFEFLYQFAGEDSPGPPDGKQPEGSLILDGSTLYGTAQLGGANDQGVIFKINTDGTGYTLLHEFTGGAGDGSQPRCTLVLKDSVLYGMSPYGGASGLGAIFKISTDGSGFSTIHEFTGQAGDGRIPSDSLTLSGTTLYGTTTSGGGRGWGMVFKIGIDGSGFISVHDFTSGEDGSSPMGHLTLSGSALYGMTNGGGGHSDGVIFKVNTDGSDFTTLHNFNRETDGGMPWYGGVIVSGSTLYGMTKRGGASDYGIIFSQGGASGGNLTPVLNILLD